MATASIRVSGPNAQRIAAQLRAALGKELGPGESVSPVELDRSAELLVAVIALVFSGVGAAKTIWDWWQDHKSQGVTVSVTLDDGTQVDLAGADLKRLEIELQRRTTTGTGS
jgi:hypothetical protein